MTNEPRPARSLTDRLRAGRANMVADRERYQAAEVTVSKADLATVLATAQRGTDAYERLTDALLRAKEERR